MTFEITRIHPDETTFRRAHRVGRSLPLVLELDAPVCDPLDLVEALPPEVPVFLLETPGGPADLQQRTFLSWAPEFRLILRAGRWQRDGAGARSTRWKCGDPLAELRRVLRDEGGGAVEYADGGFSGGYVGYVSYDFKNWLERLPDTVIDDLATPDVCMAFVRRVVGWDHRARRMTLRIHHRCVSKRARDDWKRAWDTAHAFADEVKQLCGQIPRSGGVPPTTRRGASAARVLSAGRVAPDVRRDVLKTLRSNLDRRAYDDMIARAREHILAGDIYQANLSHRFETTLDGAGATLYRGLRRINPSPFATYMRFPGHEVVSCSPERLVRVHEDRVETRPIAGTRPRGTTRSEDESLEQELLADEKERAEHLMIVDMARNDIGRVCELGSVQVERFMSIERYSHVRHLVSNVAGTLRAGRDALDVLAATFPGASITGVPKVRCMQVIDELEQLRRGVYTGSAGYIGLDGSMDLNILIRTFLVQQGHAYFNVGGGIVADSDAEREYAETLAKGRALLEALYASDGAAPARTARARSLETPTALREA